MDQNNRAYYEYEKGGHPRDSYVKCPNKLMLFFCSGLPGLNYMYMGLIKRGIFVMASFLLIGYLTGMMSSPLLGICVPIIFFASFFDGFKLRRDMKYGYRVEDSVDSILAFFARNKTITLLFVIAVLVSSVFSNVFVFRHGYHGSFDFARSVLFLLFVVGVGYYFLRNNRKNGGESSPYDR